jgi:hypothetical protein
MPRPATRGGLLELRTNSRGYKVASLCRYGKVTVIPVGRLVLITFRWPPPAPGARARYGPGGPLDNSLPNLSWG